MLMGLTLQILTKTYCCNDNKDRNIFNEDLESEGNNMIRMRKRKSYLLKEWVHFTLRSMINNIIY
jgi:hypothetical protein